MKKVLLVSTFLILATIAALGQSNVLTGTVVDIGLNPEARTTVKISLIAPNPRSIGSLLVWQNPKGVWTDSSGNFFVTNLPWGYYRMDVGGGTQSTPFFFNVFTNTTGTVPIAILFTNASALPPDPATNYYTIAQVDALVAGLTVPPLSGDVTGTTTANTVSQVGGKSASSVAATVGIVNSATSINSPGTLIIRDGSGNFSAGTIAANLSGNATSATSFTGALSGDVTGTQSSTVVANVDGIPASTVGSGVTAANNASAANAINTIVKRDGSGNFSAGTITANLTGNASTASTATNFSGSLAGDVTGTQGSTTVATVGGVSAATIASGLGAAGAATNANTPSTIVKRDGSGNFAAGTITANLVGNVTGNVTGNTSGTAASFTGSLAGDVTGTQGSTTVATVGGVAASSVASGVNAANAATSAGTGSTIVKRDSSGNFTASTVTANLTGNVTGNLTGNVTGSVTGNVTGNVTGSANGFTGSLSGDVTGTQGATSVATVGGLAAASVASGSTAANNATSANTASTIVKRDSSGNFSAGTITAALSGNASTATLATTATTANAVSGSAALPASQLTGTVSTNHLPATLAAVVQDNGVNLTNIILGVPLFPPGAVYTNNAVLGVPTYQANVVANQTYIGIVTNTLGINFITDAEFNPSSLLPDQDTLNPIGFTTTPDTIIYAYNSNGSLLGQPVQEQVYAFTTNVGIFNGLHKGIFNGTGSGLSGVVSANTLLITSNANLVFNGAHIDLDPYVYASYQRSPLSMEYTGPAMCVNLWADAGNNQGTETGAGFGTVGFNVTCINLRNSPLYNLGFNTVVVDGGWLGYRDTNGFIHENAQEWPDGISNCVRFAHSIGIKVGLWCGANTGMSQGWTPTDGTHWLGNTNVTQINAPAGKTTTQCWSNDIVTFVNWGLDYLKLENGTNSSYTMSNMQSDLQLLKSVSEKLGHHFYVQGAMGIANSNIYVVKGIYNAPRSGGFDMPVYSSGTNNIFTKFMGNFAFAQSIQNLSGPGFYCSTDIIPDRTAIAQQTTLFIMQSMLSSELCVGTPVLDPVSQPYWPITRQMVEIDQDPLAIQCYKVLSSGGVDIYQKPLFQTNSFAVMFLNTNSTSATATVTNLTAFNSSQTGMAALDIASNIISMVTTNWVVTVPGQTAYGFRMYPTNAPRYTGN